MSHSILYVLTVIIPLLKVPMNFPLANAELQLSLISFRTPVVEFGSQHLFIPLPGSITVGDLDIDMLNDRDSGHTRTSPKFF